MRYNIFDIPTFTNLQDCSKGNNGKGVSIVLNEKDDQDHHILLEKMMGAVGIDVPNDCFLITLPAKGKISIPEIRKMGVLNKLFIFGIPLKKLSLQTSEIRNQILKFEKLDILPAASLEKISTNPNEKRQLWNALKVFIDNEK